MDHGFVHVLDGLEGPGSEPVGEPCQAEHDEQQGDQPFQQRGAYEGVPVLGQDSGEESGHQHQDVGHYNQSGPVQPLHFDGLHFSQFLIGSRTVIDPEPGFHDLDGNQSDDKSAQEGGGKHKVPVAGHIHSKDPGLAEEPVNGLVGEPLEQGVGAGDHQVGPETGFRTGKAHHHPHYRMFPDPDIGHSRQGRDYHHGRIRGDVAADPQEGHNKGHQGRRHPFHAPAEESRQHTGFFTEPDGQGHGDYQAQRSESGEVLHQGSQQPLDAGGGEEVLGGYDFVGSRVFQSEACLGADGPHHGGDHKQDAEQDGRGRQFVANPLYRIQEAVQQTVFCCVLGFH